MFKYAAMCAYKPDHDITFEIINAISVKLEDAVAPLPGNQVISWLLQPKICLRFRCAIFSSPAAFERGCKPGIMILGEGPRALPLNAEIHGDRSVVVDC